jgi:hypothetical protein
MAIIGQVTLQSLEHAQYSLKDHLVVYFGAGSGQESEVESRTSAHEVRKGEP